MSSSNQCLICDLFNQVLNYNFNFKNQFNCILTNSIIGSKVKTLFMHCVLRQDSSRLSQIFCPFGLSASLCGAPVFLHWLCFGLLAYRECLRLLAVFLDLGEPAVALAINAVISMQLEVHEFVLAWMWLGPFSLRFGLAMAGFLFLVIF